MKLSSHVYLLMTTRVVLGIWLAGLLLFLGLRFELEKWVIALLLLSMAFLIDRLIQKLFKTIIMPGCPNCEVGKMRFYQRGRSKLFRLVYYKCNECNHRLKTEYRVI